MIANLKHASPPSSLRQIQRPTHIPILPHIRDHLEAISLFHLSLHQTVDPDINSLTEENVDGCCHIHPLND